MREEEVFSKKEKQILYEVAYLTLQSLAGRPSVDGSSFDLYAQALLARLHADPALFCERFTQGYVGLISELKHLDSSASDTSSS